MTDTKKYILDQQVAEKKLRRMALGIIENNPDEKLLIFAGIRDNGSVIARTIQKMISEFSPIQTEFIEIELDKRMPKDIQLSSTRDFNDQVIIIVDDVANSGKTLLYALKPFLEFHPSKIQTLVLVERSHNSFPVRPDYVGVSIATTLEEHIYVETDGERVIGAYMK